LGIQILRPMLEGAQIQNHITIINSVESLFY